MIRVNYDTETTLVKGYYPDSIPEYRIPAPFIEIEDSEQILDKQMCVIGEIYQEYMTPDNVLLEQGKQSKTAALSAINIVICFFGWVSLFLIIAGAIWGGKITIGF